MKSRANKFMNFIKEQGANPGGGAKAGMGGQGSVASLGKIPMGFLTKRRKKKLAKHEERIRGIFHLPAYIQDQIKYNVRWARRVLAMSDQDALNKGGMTKEKAREILKRYNLKGE